MNKTSIPWTDYTWTVSRGCSPVSAGCANCYAARWATRFAGAGGLYEGLAQGGKWTGRVVLCPSNLHDPLYRQKPTRIFVNSMSDVFHDQVPDGFIGALFGVMAACPQHTFQLLTKRSERAQRWFQWVTSQDPFGRPRLHVCCAALVHEVIHHPKGDGGPLHTNRSADPNGPWPLSNTWLGVTCENQAAVDNRIPLLIDIPAAVRFVSIEPMLERIDILNWLQTRYTIESKLAKTKYIHSINWVIAGCESGAGARPFNEDWARSIRDQCIEAGVPFFYKQKPAPWKGKGRVDEMPVLDGRVWNQFPGGA